MKQFIFIIIFLMLTPSIGISSDHVTPEFKRKLFKKMLKETNYKFILKGSVVDEEGNPLTNVSANIQMSEFRGVDSKRTTKKDVFDKNFSWRLGNYSSIYVRFYREGYYSEKVGFFNDTRDKERMKRIVSGQTYRDKNIRIVLKKKGETVKLRQYRPYITTTLEGKAEGYNFTRPPEKKPWEKQFAQPTTKTVKNIFDKKNLLKDVMIVTADLDANGKIPMMVDDRDRTLPVWSKLKLVITSNDAGFYRFTPEEGKPFNKIIRDMVEAPERGYEKELYLSSVKEDSIHNQNIFFYFKVRGLYGKGHLSDVTFDSGNGRIRVYVTCYLNEGGGRNLEGK